MTIGKCHVVAAIATAEKYACFNTMLELSCDEHTVLVFDTARYGRNDTRVNFTILLKVSNSLRTLVEFLYFYLVTNQTPELLSYCMYSVVEASTSLTVTSANFYSSEKLQRMRQL